MSPAKKNGSDGSETKREEWNCSKCKLGNWLSRATCRKCGADRPKGKQPPRANKPAATSPNAKKADGSASLSMRGLRQDLDYKAALMQDQLAKSEDVLMEMTEMEDLEEDGPDAQPLIDRPAKELRDELSNLESMILQSRKLNITAGTAEMEKRATHLRSALMQQKPQVQQIAHAKSLLDKAEKAVTKLEEDLESARKKVEDLLSQRDTQRRRVEASRSAYEDLLKRAQDDLDPEEDEPLAVPSSTQAQEIFNRLVLNLPAIQGQLTPDQVQGWLAMAINNTMTQTYPLLGVEDGPQAPGAPIGENAQQQQQQQVPAGQQQLQVQAPQQPIPHAAQQQGAGQAVPLQPVPPPVPAVQQQHQPVQQQAVPVQQQQQQQQQAVDNERGGHRERSPRRGPRDEEAAMQQQPQA